MKRIELSCDVWSDNQYNCIDESLTLKQAIALMKKLYKTGIHKSLRMYARDIDGIDTSVNRYYYFDNGKLKFDNDNY